MFALTLTVLIIFLLHLFEEQIWPGGFLTWWNSVVWKSSLPFFPLSEKENLNINTIGLLALGIVLILLGAFLSPHFFYILFGFMLADALQHIGFSIIKLKYSPGAYTSILYIAIIWLGINTNTSALHFAWCTIILDFILGTLILSGAYLRSYKKKQKFSFIK